MYISYVTPQPTQTAAIKNQTNTMKYMSLQYKAQVP